MPSTIVRATVQQAICALEGHDWHPDVTRAFRDGIVRRVCRRCQKRKRYQRRTVA